MPYWLFRMRPFLLLFLAVGLPASAEQPVIVIGVDGGTWAVARPLMQAGKMPRLASLVAGGAWGDIETLEPTVSPAIWTTIATGYPPWRHGVRGFTVPLPDGTTTLPRSTDWREPSLWSIASDAGRSVGVVNWWATYPAEPVNGFIVSDRANLRRRSSYRSVLDLTDEKLRTVDATETHPAKLFGQIIDSLGANLEVPAAARTLLLDPMPPDVRRNLERQPKLSRFERLSVLKFVLLQDHAAHTATRVALTTMAPPNLLVTYFSGVDAAEHQFWAYYEPHLFRKPPPQKDIAALAHVVPNYYRYMDFVIGDLLAHAPKDAIVVVVSDHGQHPNERYDPEVPGSDKGYGKWVSGAHGDAPTGILVLSGRGVRAGKIARASVFDIAPTILALLRIPPTTDMPGRVLEDALDPALRAMLPRGRLARASRTPGNAKPRSSPADEELMEKLRALGYFQ